VASGATRMGAGELCCAAHWRCGVGRRISQRCDRGELAGAGAGGGVGGGAGAWGVGQSGLALCANHRPGSP
jgi:hypothetical protein